MKTLFRVIALVASTLGVAGQAQAQWQVPANSVAIGKGAGIIGFASFGPCGVNVPMVGAGALSPPSCYGSGALGYFATGTDASHLTGAISSANLPAMASGFVLGNPAGGTTTPTGTSVYNLINTICSTPLAGSGVVFGSTGLLCQQSFVTPENASGSLQSTTGSIGAASTALTLASAIDFKNGHGVRVNHAGAAFTGAAPTAFTVTPQGTTGATTYTYTIAPFDLSGGYGPAVTAVTITNGNAALSATNYNKLQWTNNCSCGYMIYRTIAGVKTFIGTSNVPSYWDRGGSLPSSTPDYMPAIAPVASAADWLITKVVSGGGTTTPVLADQATTTASGVAVFHDDTVAIQSALTSALNVRISKNGTYTLTAKLTLQSFQNVELAPGVTIRQIGIDRNVIDASSVNYVTINGNGATLKSAGGWGPQWSGVSGHNDVALHILDCVHCRARNLITYNSSTAGVVVQAGNDVVLDGFTIIGTQGVTDSYYPSQAMVTDDNFEIGLYFLDDVGLGYVNGMNASNFVISGSAQGVLREAVLHSPSSSYNLANFIVHDLGAQHAGYLQGGKGTVTNWTMWNIPLDGIKFQADEQNTGASDFGLSASNVVGYNIGGNFFAVVSIGTGSASDVYLQGVGKNVGNGLSIAANVAGGAIKNVVADIIVDGAGGEGVLIEGPGSVDNVDVTAKLNDVQLDCVLVTVTTGTNIRVRPTAKNCNTSGAGVLGGVGISSTGVSMSVFDPRVVDTGAHMTYGLANAVAGSTMNVYGHAVVTGAQTNCVLSTGTIGAWPKDATLTSCGGANFSNTANVAAQIPTGTTFGDVTFPTQVLLTGRIDATIAADQNNYNPTGMSGASALFIDGGVADRNITGIQGGVAGRFLWLINKGTTNNLVIKNASASSSAANRFLLPNDTTLPPNTAIELRYDGTASNWRPASRALSNTGVTAATYGDATHSSQVAVSVDGRVTSASSVSVAIPCSAITDAGTVCQKNTGTSGATVPLLNGNNVWSGTFVLSGGDLKLQTGAVAYVETFDAHDMIMRADAAGGSTSASVKLQYFNGTVWADAVKFTNTASGFATFNSPPVFNVTSGSAANVIVDASGNVMRSTSSARYKHDIEPYRRGLLDVMRLQPITYKSNTDSDQKTHAGFTAEQVHAAGLREFVVYDEQNRPDAIEYANMVSLLASSEQQTAYLLAVLAGVCMLNFGGLIFCVARRRSA